MAGKKKDRSLAWLAVSPQPTKHVATLTQEVTRNLLLSRPLDEADAGSCSADHPASRSLARTDSWVMCTSMWVGCGASGATSPTSSVSMSEDIICEGENEQQEGIFGRFSGLLELGSSLAMELYPWSLLGSCLSGKHAAVGLFLHPTFTLCSPPRPHTKVFRDLMSRPSSARPPYLSTPLPTVAQASSTALPRDPLSFCFNIYL